MKTLLLVVFLFSNIAVFGQKAVCSAITTKGDTIKGFYNTFKKGELRLWDLAMQERIQIPADSLREYILASTGKEPTVYEPIKRFAELPDKEFDLVSIFTKEEEVVPMARLSEGKLFLYRYTYLREKVLPFPSGVGNMNPTENVPVYYITIDKKQFTRVKKLDVLKAKLSDCPKLVAKIGEKGYNKLDRDIEKIMDEYNACKK
jgi:hypothetical protein